MSLEQRLKERIRLEGPLTIADYMAACLFDPADGYYAVRPRLGAGGDFVTAPLVSQVFGELLGLWSAEVWTRLGRPERFRWIEVGPGDGTLIEDALRAVRLVPAFLQAAELVLVEPSRPLRELQARRLAGADLAPRWVGELSAVEDDLPAVLIANEVLDCLPARQFVRTGDGWAERRVGLNAEERLSFGLSPAAAPPSPPAKARPGDIWEASSAQAAFGATLGRLVGAAGGAGLLIDYGRAQPEPGDTFQGLRRHEKVSPLETPGHVDLTVWADFPTVLGAALGPADVTGVVGQGVFLRRLGLEARIEALAARNPERAPTLRRQADRLAGPDGMGELFKAAAVFAPRRLQVPGFEA